MSKDLCCGNCKHFKNEDVEGWGWCSFNKTKTHCAQSWDCHNSTFNGWTEITPDNVKEIESMPEVRVVYGAVVCDTVEEAFKIKEGQFLDVEKTKFVRRSTPTI